MTITKVFALELVKHNIQVNAILPGTTNTGMAEAAMANPEWTRMITEGIPMKRLGHTKDLLGAVLYFSSSDSESGIWVDWSSHAHVHRVGGRL